MDSRIQHILSRVGTRFIASSTRDLVVIPLTGGITNQNYRVDVGDESFVLRIGGQGTHLLGIDRGRERTCTAIAASLGIGAEVMDFLADEDVLITRFIIGNGITPENAAQPETLRRIVDVLKRYHAGPPFPGHFSPFETVRDYHKLALAHGVTFPATLPHAFALMEQIQQAIGPLHSPRPCHNDLLASNFIDDGQRIWIVDWEYAAMGDIFFDLGNFAVNQSLSFEQCDLLLTYYFGTVIPAHRAHLHLMRLASDLRESFWGFLQLGISELAFDYRDYAQSHLDRFLENAATPQFSQWLRDIHN